MTKVHHSAGCEVCPLNGCIKVPGEGPSPAPLVIVGEAPGAVELKLKRPFCLDENTLVLYADLTWRPLKEVRVGDKLLAFDEDATPAPTSKSAIMPLKYARRFAVSTVLNVVSREADCYEISTPYGNLVATPDHVVLTTLAKRTRTKRWLRIDQLSYNGALGKRASHLCFLFPPWTVPNDYNSGWLAGFFDGEGHVQVRKQGRCGSFRIGFTQNAGPTCEEAVQRLKEADFDVLRREESRHNGVVCCRYSIRGGALEQIRFLGNIGPQRLLHQFCKYVTDNNQRPVIRKITPAKVMSKRFVGTRRVIDIQTTTGTFIANGFMVHNCGPTGQLLDTVLRQAGLKREDIYITNSVCCMTLPPTTPKAKAIICCKSRLLDEIRSKSPKVVLALGKVAVKALLGINKPMEEERGTVRWADHLGAHVVIAYHPAFILRNPRLHRDLLADVTKAKHIAESPSDAPRVSSTIAMTYQVIDDTRSLLSHLNETHSYPTAAIDVETASDGSLLCVGVSVAKGTAAVITWGALREARSEFSDWLSKKLCIGHNLKYDLRVLRNHGIMEGSIGADTMLESYCHAVGTKVLLRDLTWKNIEDLVPGDEIVSVREDSPRDMLPGIVEDTARFEAECYAVTTSRGDTLVVSSGHRFLACREGKSPVKWYTIEHLYKYFCLGAKYYLCFFVEPWEVDTSYDGGYVAGIIDGEGCVYRLGGRGRNSKYNIHMASIAQNDGVVVRSVEKTLNDRRVSFTVRRRSGRSKLCDIKMGSRNTLRVIGMFRPNRFMEDLDSLWVGRRQFNHALITNIQYVGRQEVVGLSTSTHTLIADGYVSHNCLNPLVGGHGLKQLVREHLDYYDDYSAEIDPYYSKMEDCPRDVLYKYNAYDAALTLLLHNCLSGKLDDIDRRVLSTLLYPASNALLDMECAGVAVDLQYLHDLDQQLSEELAELERELCEVAGARFNPRSPKQLLDVMYKKLQLPVPARLSTDKKALEILSRVCDHPFIGLLQKYREKHKFHSTYVRSLLSVAHPDGRVRTTFNLHTTVTGRMSSSNPVNLQNIPRTPEARNIFVASPGHTLIEADLKTAEIRGWAWYARDEALRKAIVESGVDVHTATASLMWGLQPEEVTKEQRTKGKRMSFAVLYGMDAKTLASELDVSIDEAVELQERFFTIYPQGRRWIAEQQQRVRKEGVFVTPFGRRLRFTHNPNDPSEIDRTAINYPIQSLCSDIALSGLIRLHEKIGRGELGNTRLLLTVHDSVLLETKEPVEEIARTVKAEMEVNVLDGWMLFEAEVKAGQRWGAMEEIC